MIQLQGSAGPFHTVRGSSCSTLCGECRLPGNGKPSADTDKTVEVFETGLEMTRRQVYLDQVSRRQVPPLGPHLNLREKTVVSNSLDCYCLFKREPSQVVIANDILSMNLCLILFVQQGSNLCISCFTNHLFCSALFFLFPCPDIIWLQIIINF